MVTKNIFKFTAIAVNLKRIANLIREKEKKGKKKSGCSTLVSSFFSDLWQFEKLKVAG